MLVAVRPQSLVLAEAQVAVLLQQVRQAEMQVAERRLRQVAAALVEAQVGLLLPEAVRVARQRVVIPAVMNSEGRAAAG